MTLKDLLKVLTPVEKVKVVDFMTMETLYDNIYPLDLTAIATASGVDLEEFTVKTVGSMLDWQRNTTLTVIFVRSSEVHYGE